jgi:parvulin-like peptidyl-prolyl isomerase
MLEALLLQSVLVRPMYLGDEPPPVRSCEAILLVHSDTEGLGLRNERSADAALALARTIVDEARNGADFAQICAVHSDAEDAKQGAVLGTFAPGMLLTELDAFLFSARVGDVSDPIVIRRGEGAQAVPDHVRILRRVETHAAVRQIFVRGSDEAARERAAAIARELRAGADFGAVARERSEDPRSAARGGDFQIFERGPRDASIKRVAFELAVGAVSAPVESPMGLHVLQRAPLGELDPALAERTFVRARAILISHADVAIEGIRAERSASEAYHLAHELRARVRAGEDIGKLAREHTDDPGGGEREGDLGWIHRRAPDLPRFMDRVFVTQVGDVPPPFDTSAGYVLIRREK